ncbi:MAG: MFS transporter [Verrucomicrobia bacterium]|nr:MFS transporter [Verrucomicrobiota bacterium]
MVFIDLGPIKRNVNFRRLYMSQLISMLGSQMTMITIPFQIYGITGSTFETGLVSAVELICLLSTALWGGVIADKYNRRRIIIITEVLMMVVVALMALNATLSTPSIWLIYILAGISSAISGFHRPAIEALTPQLVARDDLSKVSALISAKFVTASLIGPTIAGYLVATVGPASTYLIDAITFGLSLFFLLRITVQLHDESLQERARHSVLKEIKEGARYIYGRKDILASYLVDFFAMVFCMPQVLFPAFAQSYKMPEWLGTLYMSVALGGVVGTVISKWTASVKRLGMAIAFSAAGWAFSIFLVGFIPYFWMLFAGFFAAGLFDSYSGIFRLTMWNESISEQYRGRIASFSMLSYMSGPLLGNTLMGFLGDSVGLHQALALGGTVSLVTIGLVVLLVPPFRRYASPS